MHKISFTALMLVMSVQTNAAQVTFEFEGEINFFRIISGDDPFDGAISVGSEFSGTYSFDTDISPTGTAQEALYLSFDPSFGINIDVAGITGSSSTATVPLNYRIKNDVAGGDIQDIQTQGFLFGGVNAIFTQIFLRDPTGTALSDAVLSSVAPDLNDYEFATFGLGVGFPNVEVLMNGSFTSFSAVQVPEAVTIDIKPGSDPNCFNSNGHGVIPVAVLGSESFDVTLIDQGSLLFSGLEVRVRGNNDPLCNLEDSDGDEFLDLVCKFEDNAAYWNPGAGDATLAGTLLDSTEFEGTDSICVVP